MDFQHLNSPEAKKFIQENMNIPVEKLLLGARKYPELNIPLLVSQIEGKNRAKKKLPSWFQSEKIIYPVKLSLEQCSSEITASYKTTLLTGESILDLSGGFGVDCTAFSKKMKRVLYVEQNTELSEIAAHNFQVLGRTNIEVFNARTEDFVLKFHERLNWVYLDPARRKEGNKVVRLSDCEPNVVDLKKSLFEIGAQIMIKTSPLLDLDIAIKELEFVKEIYVIAVENECKELLFVLDQKTTEPQITAVNIRKENRIDEFRFDRISESNAKVKYNMPINYLYEPNAAILKAGAFKSVVANTEMFKLNSSSHLYTSDEFIENFPGRSFKILKKIKYSKKEILAELPDGKANITVRNFPDSVDLIRKKTGVKEGGEIYLFASKDLYDKPIILLTEKLN